MVDIDELKAFTAAMWGQGDYGRLADRLMPAAIALVEAVGVRAGQAVLDVAAGDGNAAVVAAERGAVVTASDLAPGMVERGRARARAEGLAVAWVRADVEDLPFPDASFDVVTSVFGAMFAPRPEVVVAEVGRVLRPGGVFGMANWQPEGYFGKMTEVMRPWWSSSPELPQPLDWGREEVARERLDAVFSVQFGHGSLPWVFDSPEVSRAFLEAHSPSHVAAADVIGAEAFKAMMDAVETFDRDHADPQGRVNVGAEYLLVAARKPQSIPPR